MALNDPQSLWCQFGFQRKRTDTNKFVPSSFAFRRTWSLLIFHDVKDDLYGVSPLEYEEMSNPLCRLKIRGLYRPDPN